MSNPIYESAYTKAGLIESMSPREYRLLRRQHKLIGETLGNCRGYISANVAIIPKEVALEFFLFCQRNPKPCTPMDVTDPGNPEPIRVAPGADLRTDLGRYYVYKYGELIDEPTDITDYWRDDLVSFVMGASPSWHYVLSDAKLQYTFVGAYVTNIQTIPAGPFKGPMVVGCRVFNDALDAIRAIQITSRYVLCNGAPVHIGDPSIIGIDISKPVVCLEGNPHLRPLQPGQVPVFWAVGPTVQTVAVAAKLDLLVMHVPGWNLATDIHLEQVALF